MNTIKNMQYALSILWKFNRKYVLVSLALTVFSIIDPIISVYSIKLFLDMVAEGRSYQDLLFFIFIFAGIMVLSAFLKAWDRNRFTPIEKNKLQAKVRKLFYKKSCEVDLKHLDDPKFYDLYTRALSQADQRLFQVLDSITNFLSNLFSLTTLISLVAFMDPVVIAISCLSLAVILLANIKNQKVHYKEYTETVLPQRKYDYVNRIFYLDKYAKEIRTYSLKDNLIRLLLKSSDQLQKIYKKNAPKKSLYSVFSSLANVILIIGMMAYLSYRILNGHLSVGDFAALLSGSQQLVGMLGGFISIIPQVKEHSMYIQDLRDFLATESVIESNNNGIIMPANTPNSIKIQNLSFSYPATERKVLDNISLDIPSGSSIAFVGENGAGKTTLVKLLLRLYDADSGEILFDNHNIMDYNTHSLRKNIGVVFQDFQNYALSIRDNICFDNTEISDDELFDILDQYGLSEKIRALPEGLDTIIGNEIEQGAQFSGGELQRLALARIQVVQSGIVILDEPSSALDPIAEYELNNKIQALCKNKTLIFISHRLSTTRFVDQIFLVKNGKIIEHGKHEELMALNGEYAKMFNIQAENYLK